VAKSCIPVYKPFIGFWQPRKAGLNSLLHLLLKNGDFLNTDISQGSVATRLGCGGIVVYHFVTNFLLSLTVKEF